MLNHAVAISIPSNGQCLSTDDWRIRCKIIRTDLCCVECIDSNTRVSSYYTWKLDVPIDLVLHLPCVTYLMLYPLMNSVTLRGVDEHTAIVRAWHTLPY